MKKYLCLTAGIILSILLWSASSSAIDKTDRIAFIDMQKILQNSNAGKKAIEDLKKHFEKDHLEINSAEEELKKMKEELESRDSKMSQDDRNEKETAYRKKLRDYQLKVNDAKEELKKRDQEMTQKLVPRILKVVESIAAKEKYDVVADMSLAPVPFYSTENDISSRVIEEFNEAE